MVLFSTHTAFQFTHPGGVRRQEDGYPPTHYLFQFTHPGGVRLYLTIYSLDGGLFQFTHPGGVRPSAESLGIRSPQVSIHAPGRGATPVVHTVRRRTLGFNSRTREGCDVQADEIIYLRTLFQFTHPGGVRLKRQ